MINEISGFKNLSKTQQNKTIETQRQRHKERYKTQMI